MKLIPFLMVIKQWFKADLYVSKQCLIAHYQMARELWKVIIRIIKADFK